MSTFTKDNPCECGGYGGPESHAARCPNSKQVKPVVRKPPAAGKGRVKGSLNKTTRTAKEAIALAAEGLGGAERLITWAQEDPLNERAFWSSIYPKLLPLQVNGAGENGEHLFKAIEWRIVKPGA